MQINILDFLAISLGIVAALRPAADILQPIRPLRKLCNKTSFVLVTEHCVVACVIVFGCARVLVTQDWFTGGTGQQDLVSARHDINDGYYITIS